jgi:branched-subunit amino acid aminotransferase/4-amino-4-deoxychorismate lyase
MSGAGAGARVWLDGNVLERDAAAVPASDLGLRQGLGVFETLRVRAGRTAGFEAHLARLVDGWARLGITVDPDAVRAGLAALVATEPGEVVARVTVTAGDAGPGWPPSAAGTPRTLVTLHPAPPRPASPVDAAVVPGPRAPAGLADVKTTSYAGSVLATRRANARGAEVALIEVDDEVLEAADGNVIAVHGTVLTTPPCDGRVIPGVTRRLVLGLAPDAGLAVREAPLTRAVLATADLVVVSSAVRGLRPLRSIDGTPITGGGTHPALSELLAGLDRLATAAPPLTASIAPPTA